MKKLLLLLSICSLSLGATAQQSVDGVRSSTDYAPSTSDSRNNGFGIKGGFNLADLRGGDRSTYEDRLSNLKTYHVGAYAQFGFNDKVSIQPEILFSRKGYDDRLAIPVGSSAPATVRETRLDYIQVPVLFVYNFLDNVSVHVGPQASLLVRAKYAGTDKSISGAGLHSLDYGVVGGLEARIGPARVGARYDMGLADVYKDTSEASRSFYKDVKNGTFQVYVGVGFTN
ncbi:PorT family protein [Hymenobacter tibetensis]|uniref:PorT family protein n=1 Tax=Hymenobacter tibetensis TaxID=497967 RepID=A0ABY4CWT2_9BACT|nr:porin family protein [Hymenobacter tibetensis]UOG74608.1 PorT family protein [Hymenobacter tibetensis]